MSESSLLQQLADLEAEIHYREAPADGRPPFAYVPGRLPVLLSAPHGARHWRAAKGRYKGEDEYTSALARLVARRSGAHVLYATHQADSDPNFDARAPFKDRLRAIAREQGLRFVLDLHGSRDKQRFGLALGTINGSSCDAEQVAHIVAALTANGFEQWTQTAVEQLERLRMDTFVVNHRRYTGGTHQHTVTRFVSEVLALPAAQLEIAASLRIAERRAEAGAKRPFQGSASGIGRIVAALEQMVPALAG